MCKTGHNHLWDSRVNLFQNVRLDHDAAAENYAGRVKMCIRDRIGGCYSILIGVFCAVLSSVIGAILGAIAGYFGGKTDAAIIRISEIFQAFPQLVLVMMLVAIVNKRGLGNLLFIFVFTGWMTTFRMVRNEFVSIKGETYVKVCEAFGMSRMNIMFKQILPNVMLSLIHISCDCK